MKRLVVGVAQMCSSEDREANYEVVARLVAEAKARGVDLCCFPEAFHFIGRGDGGLQSADIAEPLQPLAMAPSLTKYADLARTHRIMLSLGGFQERPSGETAAGDGGKVCNSHVLVGADGTFLGVYRKMHLFDYPSGGLMESNFTSAGDTPVAVQLPESFKGWTVGLTTCYDLRFPSLQPQRNSGFQLHVLSITRANGLRRFVL